MTDTKTTKLTRRNLLRIGGCAGIVAASGAVGGGYLATQTDFFDRLRGISQTPVLDNPDAWAYAGSTLRLDLIAIPDLVDLNSAVQLDDDALPEPLLIVHGGDDNYYVYVNKCPHADRKIDPINGKLECTSFSQSTFTYAGAVTGGPADSPLTTYTVEREDDSLIVTLA